MVIRYANHYTDASVHWDGRIFLLRHGACKGVSGLGCIIFTSTNVIVAPLVSEENEENSDIGFCACHFPKMNEFPQMVSCTCGQVEFQASGKPIVTATCYCEDCQAAGQIFDKLQNIKPFCEEDGGTPYVTLHDKNWVCIKGENLLKPLKLTPASPTTRYITTCCSSPMFIKFKSGFWTSTYRACYAQPPKLEWRNKVGKRNSTLPFADDIPRYKGFPLQLFGRLIKAWLGR